jgi:hypothetical protein
MNRMHIASPAALALAALIALPAYAANDGRGSKEQRNEQTLEQVLQEAATAGERPGGKDEAEAAEKTPPAAEAKAADKSSGATAAPAKDPKAATPAASRAAPPAAGTVAPAATQAPPTDDNDDTAEATAPTPLRAAAPPAGQARTRGPYELGALDCRVLDGAGIERILPPRLIAGEEPDLLCRILVTQPPNIASLAHQVTFSVTIADRETFRQVRNVRMSSIGRRALVFVVPADRIATDSSAAVRIHASLSPPALPAVGQTVKFTVETED